MAESIAEQVEQPRRSLDWREIVRSNEKAQKGRHNPYRKTLLSEGVYVDVSPRKAESWIPVLRTQRQTAEEVSNARGETLPTQNSPVRITIKNIPQATIDNHISGTMLVSAGGVEAEMDCSVFYNCIPGRDTDPIAFSSGGHLMGHGNALPTRGEGSHSNYDAPRLT